MASSDRKVPANILQGQNKDVVDGFRKRLRESFAKFSCVRGTLRSSNNGNQQQQPAQDPEFEDKYNFSHSKRGMAIIINNEDFSKYDPLWNRVGSKMDASALYNSFKLLGFDVFPFTDLKAWEMVEVLEAATKYYNHGASDCFACAVLTHGHYTESTNERLDVLFGVDGKAVATNYLVETFNDTYCPALKDKPRLFFLQACRGANCDDGQSILVGDIEQDIPLHQEQGGDQLVKEKALAVYLQEASFSSSVEALQKLALDKRDAAEDVEDEKRQKPPKDPLPRPAPLYNDFLIMYATPSGYTAWRHEEKGSWFIQTLCEVLDGTDLTSISLLRALTKVNGLIARNFKSENKEDPDKKEISVIQTRLLKDIFMSKKTKETAV